MKVTTLWSSPVTCPKGNVENFSPFSTLNLSLAAKRDLCFSGDVYAVGFSGTGCEATKSLTKRTAYLSSNSFTRGAFADFTINPA